MIIVMLISQLTIRCDVVVNLASLFGDAQIASLETAFLGTAIGAVACYIRATRSGGRSDVVCLFALTEVGAISRTIFVASLVVDHICQEFNIL